MKTAIIAAMLVLFAVPVVAVTYQWEDNQGTVNFTEDLGSIPKQYRKKAKVLGAEEEVAPAEPSTKPEVKSGPEGKGRDVDQSAEVKKEQKKLYGGKSGSAWKMEFADIDRQIKYEEEQLGDLKYRINDTSKMSRGEYRSIQMGINNSESRLKRLKERREALSADADRANLPKEFR